MAVSIVPALIDALVAQGGAVLEVPVYDGPGNSDDYVDCVMVGVEDPDIDGLLFSGSTDQSVANMGPTRSRDDVGEIICAARASSGDTEVKVVRDRAWSYMEAFATLFRSNPNLGLAAGGYLVCEIGSTRYSQTLYKDGAEALLIFTVKFRARI